MLDQGSDFPADSSAQNAPAAKTTPSSPHTADFRKTYLSLLPHEQIIEICLLFESHVPLDVKSTVWPADLEAAILELKKKKASAPPQPPPDAFAAPTPTSNGTTNSVVTGTPAHQVQPPGHLASPPRLDEVPPMGSLRDAVEAARERERENEKASAATSAAPSTSSPAPAPPQANGGDPSSSRQHTPLVGTPQPSGASQHAPLHPPPPYPYGPYGYPMPQPQGSQAAYPHAPYYPSYASPYPYPHYPPPPGYPAPSPGHSPPPHPHAPGGQALFNSSPLVRPPLPSGAVAVPQPPPPPPPSNEDLPSYEEMIVEALLDCGDVEGAAPKDLFTWMASRYPLQTNFRPSASQALQKAYKRGRLEKRQGGKYRLNASWEGGATSKRTTRRPQTLAQTTYAMHHPQQPSSPFTNAPLQHPHPPASAHQPPYNGYPYQYPYGHYPGYPLPPQPAQDKLAAATPTASTSTAAAKQTEDKDEAADSGDAWEAAQHILKAINFGGLAQADASARATSSAGAQAAAAGSSAAEGDELGAVLSALASVAAAAAASSSNAEPPRSSLTDDERASLQAQLALLAAQLTEIAEAEDEEVLPPAAYTPAPAPASAISPPASVPAPPALLAQPTPSRQSAAAAPPQTPAYLPPQIAQPKQVEPPPPPIAAYAGTHLVLDVNAFPEVFAPRAPLPGLASGAQTEVEMGEEDSGDEDEDDDDMEDVVVPLAPPAGHEALRT